MLLRRFLIYFFISFALISCGDENVGTKIGQNAPLINSKNSNDEKITLKKQGLEVVLFWESGCAGCISAMPHLDKYATTHKVKIYAINSINKKTIINQFEKTHNFFNIMILEDVLNISWDNYKINFVPSMFIIKDGVIVEKILGDRLWKHIEPKLSKHL